ncbi:MAG: class I SAM-dependent methyltransferase [Rhodospirillales bacterium]
MVSRALWDQIASTDVISLGKQSSLGYRIDPKHLVFVLARYKFVAKMAESVSCTKGLEVGCGDGFATPIVAQVVPSIRAVDLEMQTLETRSDHPMLDERVTFAQHDILSSPVSDGGPFDLCYSLDVVEHIPHELDPKYYENIARSLGPRGAAIIGTPNKAAEAHQSPQSREGHINLKSPRQLKADMENWFDYVLMFGMNDEVVHTGFPDMAHYLFAVGLGPKL